MSLLDDAGGLLNRGMASAGRSTRSMSLKAQINELNKQREALTAKLGAALYKETRHDQRLRAVSGDLFASIEALDERRETLLNELNSLEMQAQLAAANKSKGGTSVTLTCPACGMQITEAGAAFCSGCGADISSLKSSMNLCLVCGSPLGEGDMFCAGCGSAVPAKPDVAETEDVTQLRAELQQDRKETEQEHLPPAEEGLS